MQRIAARLACPAVLVIVGVGIFAYTIPLRRPCMGTTTAFESWVASHTLLFSKNWYREGPASLDFGLFWNPKSIEYPTLATRDVYASHAPGMVVPIYLLSKLRGHEPTRMLIAKYDLMNHLAAALMLAFMTLAVARQAGWPRFSATLFGAIPMVLFLLLPIPLYLYTVIFFADQACLLLFIAFLLCEVLRPDVAGTRLARPLAVIQGMIAFAGILTYWFFAFVAFSVYVKRLFCGELGKGVRGFLGYSILFWLPVALGIGLFALQVIILGGTEYLFQRFELRTGMTDGKFMQPTTQNLFWKLHMVRGFGLVGIWALAVSCAFVPLGTAYAAVRRLLKREASVSIARPLALAFMALAPCLLHLLVFSSQCANPFHYFEALKFAVPIALIPLTLMPMFALGCLRPRRDALAASILAQPHFIPLLAALLAIGYAGYEWPRVMPQFTLKAFQERGGLEAAEFIGKNARYEDVVFSWDSVVLEASSELYRPHSMKLVHQAMASQDFYDIVRDIKDEYVIAVVTRPGKSVSPGAAMDAFLKKAYDRVDSGGMRLERIRKADLLEQIRAEASAK